MPLLTKVGSFTSPASATLGNQVVTGLGFQPKAILFWSGPAGGSGTWVANVSQALGFTTGPTNSFCVFSGSLDANTASDSVRRMAAKAITKVSTDAATIGIEADLVSFNADGFTLNWTTIFNNSFWFSHNINYMALGGSDITGAKVVAWDLSNVAGNVSVTGVGFKPDLVMHSHITNPGSLPITNIFAQLSFGMMNKHGQQWANAFGSVDNNNPSNTARWQQTDACLIAVQGDETAQQQAHFVSMDADGFTLAKSTLGSNQKVMSLCLQGVSSKIGAFAKTTAAAPAAQTIERVGFTPKAVLFSGQSLPAQGAPSTRAKWALGASDGTNQRASDLNDNDAVTPTQAKSVFYNDASLLTTDGGATFSKGGTTALDADGFSLSWNPNDATNPSEHLYLALGDAGTDTFPSKMGGLNASSQATAFSNQRKIDRCQNGNIVTMVQDVGGSTGYPSVSTDGGLTWAGFTSISGWVNGSIFIDLDDYLHVVWKQSGTGGGRTDGWIYYMRGTPNAGRTSWTWSAATVLHSHTGYNYPDLIVHREGTGWTVHTVISFNDGSAGYPGNFYKPITISSGGVISVGVQITVGSGYNSGASTHTFPSIDFNHTGDGKTVAGGTPHLYTAWSAGATGAGKGIRFKKATYSGGSWTWGAEREIDNTIAPDGGDRHIICMFDGTRAVISAIGNVGGADDQWRIYDRDVADTTTTTRTLESGGNYSRLYKGSVTYDSAGNIYLVGERYVGVFDGLYIHKWVRATNTLNARIQTESGSFHRYVSMKRGYSFDRVEWVYTSGNNSPYTVKYDRIVESLGYYVPQIML